jgi:ATP-binding cassette, subfamily B, bacterial PglK
MNILFKIKEIVPKSLYLKFVFLFILTIFGIFLELLGIGLVLPIITIVVTGNYDLDIGFGIDKIVNLFNLNNSETFVTPLLILLSVYAIKGIYLFFLGCYNARYVYLLNTKLSEQLYKNYLDQDYLFHVKKNSSEMIRIVIAEINFFIKNVIMPLLLVIMEILVFFGITILLLSVDTKNTIYIILIFLILGIFYFLLINKKLTKWGKEKIYHEGLRLKNLTQGLNGIKIVKMFNRENFFLNTFNVNSYRSAKVVENATILSQIPRIAVEFIAVFLIIFFIIFNVESSSNLPEQFPKLALFAAAAFRLMPSVNRLFNNLQTLRYSAPSVNLMYSQYPLKNKEYNDNNNLSKFDFSKNINISNLSFKYPETKGHVLKNINFEIKFGESIGIIGETGSGKTTLIDIICGLVDAESGKISVDGVDIRSNIRSWQKNIGYVPQNVYLLDDTIRKNIIFGQKKDEKSEENLINSIKYSQLDKLISNLPDDLETIVGERGARLSGGQVQRIGIARALNNNAKLLIFDESTSALDIQTEKELINKISKLKNKKTLIMISHRLSVLENCDKIYEVKNQNIYLKK